MSHLLNGRTETVKCLLRLQHA